MKETALQKIIGAKGAKNIASATVAIVGLGGVGSSVAQLLIRNGVNLRIIDKDRVLEADVPRQSMYKAEDLSKFKAKQAKKHLEETISGSKVKAFHEELVKDNIFLLEADIIIDASNDMQTSLLIDTFAKSKKTPLVFVNYSGEKGQVLFVDKKPKAVRIKDIEKKLEIASIKEAGVFSPLATMLAGIVGNVVFNYLKDSTVEEHLLKVDAFANKIQHNKVEKPKKK
jgi:molybdopterin/thiamine biosynthesis adenylyltransferase